MQPIHHDLDCKLELANCGQKYWHDQCQQSISYISTGCYIWRHRAHNWIKWQARCLQIKKFFSTFHHKCQRINIRRVAFKSQQQLTLERDDDVRKVGVDLLVRSVSFNPRTEHLGQHTSSLSPLLLTLERVRQGLHNTNTTRQLSKPERDIVMFSK